MNVVSFLMKKKQEKERELLQGYMFSLIRNSTPRGPYSRTMSRALCCPWGGWLFLMSEVPLSMKQTQEKERNLLLLAPRAPQGKR